MKPSKPKEVPCGTTLFCPLFEHQKNVAACTVLRAKRVCREDCVKYLLWARENIDTVTNILLKYRKTIEGNRKVPELLERVLPPGTHLCEICGKSFIQEGRLAAHLKRKHRRSLV